MSYGYEQVRYEVKYPVRFAQGTKLLADLAPFLVPDPHGKNGQYAVYSVYFDTRRLNSYRDKIDGFAGRIKFRLRTYLGKSNPVSFLESEERIRHYIAKHRACLTEEQANMLIHTHLSPGTLEGIVPADHPLTIRLAMASQYGVFVPSVAIYYPRTAFIFKGARDVRVTLDHNLLALPPRTPTARLPRILPSDPHDQFLVEIKGNGWMPVEVVDAICRNNLVAGSFSKYCAGVERAYHLPPHG